MAHATRPMTEFPPSRWKVVERGRRLEVIDTQAETVSPIPVDRRTALSLPRQVRFDGGAELTTHGLYDEKAPRHIRLDAGSAATLKRVQGILVAIVLALVVGIVFWPWLLLLLVPLFQANIRKPLRARVTRWLDRVEREGS